MAKLRIYDQAIDLVRTTDFSTVALGVAFTASENPPDPTDTLATDLTQIDYTNLSGDLNLTVSSVDQGDDGDPFVVYIADKYVSASEDGPVGPFRYAHIFNISNYDLFFHYDLEDDVEIEASGILRLDFSQALGAFRIRFNPQ